VAQDFSSFAEGGFDDPIRTLASANRSHPLLSYNGGPISPRANEIVLNAARNVLNEWLYFAG
jgi:hypothetical protein